MSPLSRPWIRLGRGSGRAGLTSSELTGLGPSGAGAPAPPLVLVAHGTRDEAGTALIGRLADAVADLLPGVEVRPAFVDVRPPTVAEVLDQVLDPSGPAAVVVPAFLAAGYHVRSDLPAQVAAAGYTGRVRLTPLLGPDPAVIAAAADRLLRAGWRPDDVVVLGAAGSRDPRAAEDLRRAAAALSRRLGSEVRAGYLASGEPRLPELVERLRRGPAFGRRVTAASWLLAPGFFQRRLQDCGADRVSEPLGVHAAVVRAVVARYKEAVAGQVEDAGLLYPAGSH
jgi:sirohydrochlorin ferrochelatase